MNTNMIGFRWFTKIFASLYFGRSSASIERVKVWIKNETIFTYKTQSIHSCKESHTFSGITFWYVLICKAQLHYKNICDHPLNPNWDHQDENRKEREQICQPSQNSGMLDEDWITIASNVLALGLRDINSQFYIKFFRFLWVWGRGMKGKAITVSLHSSTCSVYSKKRQHLVLFYVADRVEAAQGKDREMWCKVSRNYLSLYRGGIGKILRHMIQCIWKNIHVYIELGRKKYRNMILSIWKNIYVYIELAQERMRNMMSSI